MFCAIAAGESGAAVVLRTARVLVFLDKSPLFFGHALVVPVAHHETLADLPPDLVPEYFSVVRSVSAAVPAALGAGGSFVALNNRISQSVPHLHTHVVPRSRGDGLRGFFWPRKKYQGGLDEMRTYADRIAAALAPELPDR